MGWAGLPHSRVAGVPESRYQCSRKSRWCLCVTLLKIRNHPGRLQGHRQGLLVTVRLLEPLPRGLPAYPQGPSEAGTGNSSGQGRSGSPPEPLSVHVAQLGLEPRSLTPTVPFYRRAAPWSATNSMQMAAIPRLLGGRMPGSPEECKGP